MPIIVLKNSTFLFTCENWKPDCVSSYGPRLNATKYRKRLWSPPPPNNNLDNASATIWENSRWTCLQICSKRYKEDNRPNLIRSYYSPFSRGKFLGNERRATFVRTWKNLIPTSGIVVWGRKKLRKFTGWYFCPILIRFRWQNRRGSRSRIIWPRFGVNGFWYSKFFF